VPITRASKAAYKCWCQKGSDGQRWTVAAHRVCRSKSAEPNLLGFVRPEILDQEPSGDENLDVAKDKIAQQR